MRLSHLSFQIRWADSDVSILNSLFFAERGFPFLSLNIAEPHPIIVPCVILGQLLYFFSHNSSARDQIIFCSGSSQSVKMCSIDSSISHFGQIALCSCSGMLFQYDPTL